VNRVAKKSEYEFKKKNTSEAVVHFLVKFIGFRFMVVKKHCCHCSHLILSLQ